MRIRWLVLAVAATVPTALFFAGMMIDSSVLGLAGLFTLSFVPLTFFNAKTASPMSKLQTREPSAVVPPRRAA